MFTPYSRFWLLPEQWGCRTLRAIKTVKARVYIPGRGGREGTTPETTASPEAGKVKARHSEKRKNKKKKKRNYRGTYITFPPKKFWYIRLVHRVCQPFPSGRTILRSTSRYVSHPRNRATHKLRVRATGMSLASVLCSTPPSVPTVGTRPTSGSGRVAQHPPCCFSR